MSDSVIDQGGAVREGEALPLEALLPWLRERLPALEGTPEVRQYSGGASNWTYCLQFANRDLILRRAPAGTKARGAHDMGREYRLQKALKPLFGAVPEVLAHCDDAQVLGTEFYLMERLQGVIPRRHFPRALALTPTRTRQVCESALDTLIQLHQVDTAPLAEFGKGSGYIERQIAGWSQRYQKARTWNVGSGKRVMRYLEANLPRRERQALIHNDYRFDNLVLAPDDPSRVLGVLDWELATLGDPLMDLGNTLAYWVQADDDAVLRSARLQPTHLPGMLSRQEVVQYYCERTGIECDDFTFYEVYGLFRLAGIMQQIYYRYHHGQTRNPRFKRFWFFVNYLLWRCDRRIRAAR
ncbi:phosphotransferase family protein [Ferrimonas balearica]|uniref:phosphotransferase family protein n=1 Tax=Ferrimonas balearica TaxID=44012 RepID=UPI001C577999|nr:phosphotransferase family protein [Ferrimonas balearica]MBW3139642.1 phosphotransferase family protein [Ferrimonas balearica]MBY6107250.1 phosphotransferase family protein [Ferrimonas balearica]